ncbi:MAG: Flp pilus assembly complex ATPase component TadA [Candidatus Omnitrophica bacterium]|nr:Flp pilus assembly complex ATPase component TadA [Candidatus Omnitrophota bacterium]
MAKKIDLILYEALIEKGLLSKKDLDAILNEIEAAGVSLQDFLVRRKICPERQVLKVLSEKLKVPIIELKNTKIEHAVLDKVAVKIASYYVFLPVEIKDRVLSIAVSRPLDIKTQDEIRTQLGCDIEVYFALSSDILDGLKKYYGLAPDTLDSIMSNIAKSPESSGDLGQEKVEDIEKLAEDASVIKLVNQIILEAYRKRATDIHLEPYRNNVSLRYRIDGLLYDANVKTEIRNFLNSIISRVKIMSNLNIVERRLPQDGRAVVRVQEQVLDLRISTIPTPYGESVVIRILPTQMLFSLEKLGLAKKDIKVFEGLIQKPHGIIFVTGPTGSGKTTTLYACLSRINTKERKIITIEDPIEYEMSGITQIQVAPEIGLDFARGLRSMLRHDPDVMMVGEVRDLETAEIAIRVALTGHLVFSTLHTNDAASGITRLIDIGVEPYLVASSIEAFIAQRLIRLLCPECKYEDQNAPLELKELIANDLGLKSKEDIRIYRSKGCPNCNFSGFFGRTAIYEIILVDDTIKDLILKKASSGQIKKAALSKGMRTLRQDGWQKTILGLTTPEEVMKVTPVEEQAQEQKSLSYGDFTSYNTQGDQHDKRAYPRLNDKINLRYKLIKSEGELLKRGITPEQLSVTKNISAGGLLFIADEPLALGAILEINVEIPGEQPIQCLAKIVRAEESQGGKRFDVAVCFLDLTGAERKRLNKYVEGEL